MDRIEELKQQKESHYSLLQEVLYNTEYKFSDKQKEFLSHIIEKEITWLEHAIVREKVQAM